MTMAPARAVTFVSAGPALIAQSSCLTSHEVSLHQKCMPPLPIQRETQLMLGAITLYMETHGKAYEGSPCDNLPA